MEYSILVIHDSKHLDHPALDAGYAIIQIEHEQLMAPATVNIDKQTPDKRNNLIKLLNSINVTQLPVVVFMKFDESGVPKIITHITKNFHQDKIQKTMLEILDGTFKGTGEEQQGQGSGYAGSGFGFGLFDLGKIPWILLAAYSGKKTLESKTTLVQVGFGSLTAYAIWNITKN
ncbi:MAG: hypothetical protein AAF901_12625 [Bacteroidota bacterium]